MSGELDMSTAQLIRERDEAKTQVEALTRELAEERASREREAGLRQAAEADRDDLLAQRELMTQAFGGLLGVESGAAEAGLIAPRSVPGGPVSSTSRAPETPRDVTPLPFGTPPPWMPPALIAGGPAVGLLSHEPADPSEARIAELVNLTVEFQREIARLRLEVDQIRAEVGQRDALVDSIQNLDAGQTTEQLAERVAFLTLSLERERARASTLEERLEGMRSEAIAGLTNEDDDEHLDPPPSLVIKLT